jgi:signal transduction histidine kinase
MILLCLVVGWHQTSRMVRALTETEKLNRELEQRVADKHAELKQSFGRVQAMEKQTAVNEERQRIMSEMHDGIGAQLIATLELVEQGDTTSTKIAGELREVLDSLRLTVDSLEPAENDLLSVLANLRYRLEGRMTKQGIRLNWQVSDVPRLDSLTPQQVLDILRILQEAFTNIVKHAEAKTITIATGFNDAWVFICIVDDGRGFVTNREGRGLTNMRRRAEALRAKLDIIASKTGTSLSLYLPRSA